ncbi:hypothetical protein [Streptomyces subrutilus]|uniref:hypothetical protein n=1 Tax=Streptomyces subrutilus TaxID=36818 RepID=UPI0033E50418
MNVTSEGGRVHIADPTHSNESPRPLYRTEAMDGVTFYFTDAPVDCKTCLLLDNINRNNATTDGEIMPPKKKTEAATDAKADVDILISDIHATVDQIKAIDPASEGAAVKANELKSEGEAKIRQLPTARRNTLRKALNDAHKAATTKPEPEPTPAAAAPSTEVVKVSDNPEDFENVPALIALGVEKMKEGVDAGLQLTSAGEVVAKVLLTIRQNIIDPETKLPDLPFRLKVTRNSAGDVYSKSLDGVPDDDVERRAAHAALQKATQNKSSDVLVDWLRSYDADNEDSMAMLRELYPDAADAVEANRAERAEKGDDAAEVLTPEQAIRNLYAAHDIELPLRGRTEQMRINRRVEKVQKAVHELATAKEDNNAEKVEKLQGEINDLKADLPADALEKLGEPEKEKTDAEKANEALERAWKALETAGKRAKKVTNAAQKRKIKAQMYEKIREMAADFDLDLSALVPAEESGE